MKIPLALQLYTVREDLKVDYRSTIEAVAAMGYQGVEVTGNFGGMTPKELSAFFRSVGVVVAGMHVDAESMLDPGSTMYQYAEALSTPYVSISCAWEVEKDWNATIDRIERAASVAASKGIGFTYHNHAEEFLKIDGRYALDILYERTEATLVQCELDTYWIKRGGEDPAAYIRKYKDRTPQVHLKDMDPADGSFTEIGAGLMDLVAIYSAAAHVGARWMIVEQDRNWKPTGTESARTSIENLRKGGFV